MLGARNQKVQSTEVEAAQEILVMEVED